ncbi:SLATT domain-containing protein [Photobacterium sp. J15]|uniref:SLATT domain-containing protein n=1 Tax=Photobacterium sp. J15 TaxID=265901 RepID=UPI0007E41033|nr:SLATT domain-containing protein [Photobacterium sp. J15]
MVVIEQILKHKKHNKPVPTFSSHEETLKNWLDRITKAQIGHYMRAEKLNWRADWTGYLLVFCTVFVTAMSFFSYTGNLNGIEAITIPLIKWKVNSSNMQYVVIFVGGLSAILSGVVSQARFAARAEQHRAAAGRYGNTRRKIERLLTKLNTGNLEGLDIENEIDKIELEWNFTSADAPLTKKKVIDKVAKNAT